MNPNTAACIAASIRLPNLPSVISNVWVGAAMAGWAAGQTGRFPSAPAIGAAITAACLLYIGGNLLNDWHDRDWDRIHRPERALPQNAVSPALFLSAAILLLLAGCAIAWLASPASAAAAVLILLAILAYTRWHKSHPCAAVWIALCRALLPMLCLAPSFAPTVLNPSSPGAIWPLVMPSLALFTYIAAISLIARHETGTTFPPATRPLWRALLYSSAPLMMLPLLPLPPVISLLALSPFALCLVINLNRKRTSPAGLVSSLLAAIPLLDWTLLLPLCLLLWDAGAPPAIVLAHGILPPLAAVAAILLQRFVPAT